MRLFACVGLIWISENLPHDGGFAGMESVVIQLTESAINLGPEVIAEAISFLAWYVQDPINDVDRCPQSAVAILILSSILQQPDDDAFQWLISTIRNEHIETDEWDAWENEPHRFFTFCGEKQKWRHLIPEVLLAPKQKHASVRRLAKDLLREIACKNEATILAKSLNTFALKESEPCSPYKQASADLESGISLLPISLHTTLSHQPASPKTTLFDPAFAQVGRSVLQS